MQKSGTIKFFLPSPEKRFGFITGEDGQEYFFFHTEIKSGEPKKGASVTFDTKEAKKGMVAINIDVK
jgi:cold shock CspA family protein